MIDLTGAIYARRSKRGDNLSCENQVERCLAYVHTVASRLTGRYGDDVNVHIPEKLIFQDKGETGQNFDRAAYDRLRQAIAGRGIHLLFIYAVDRLGRTEDVTDMFLERRFCIEHGVQVWCESKDLEITGTDEMTLIQFFFESLWARRELEDIRRRTMQGRWTAHKVDDEYVAFGGRPVLGLAVDEDTKHFIIDEEGARIVRLMRDWVLVEFLSCIDIAKRLQRMGMPTPGRGRWSARTVGRILENPAIAGLGVQVRPEDTDSGERRTILVPTPAVISPDEFEQVQRVLAGRKQSRTGRRYTYLLTGTLFCSACGRAMIGSGNRHGAYYKCPARSKYKELDTEPCPMVIVPKRAIETPVLEHVMHVVQHPVVLLEAAKDGETDELGRIEARARAVKRELAEARAARERLVMEWAYRMIDQAALTGAMEKTRARVEELEKEDLQLQWRQMVLRQQRQKSDPLAGIADMPLAELSEKAKRDIIRRLVYRIDLHQTGEKQARADIKYYRLDAALHSLAGRNPAILSSQATFVPLSVSIGWR